MTKRAPCGVININKPAGKTSTDIVNRVSWLLRKSTGIKKLKAGHCGTLDPMATGVLVVCVGAATRLVPLVQDHAKTYRGRFLLGRSTDSDDITGQTLREVDVAPDSIQSADLESLLPQFTGPIQQVPPQISAVLIDGARAYHLARSGVELTLPPRNVVVHRLELVRFELPQFELEMECGSGTYVRSIGRDMGEKLGCGATMTELARTSIGPFSIQSATPLEELSLENVMSRVEPPLTVVPQLPRVTLNAEQIARIRTGNYVRPDELVDTFEGRVCLLMPSGELLAVATIDREYSVYRPEMVFLEAC